MLTTAQTKVLKALDEHGELVDKRLKTIAGLGGPQGTSVVCRSLMNRGLIERELVKRGSDLDSFYSYRITEAGREAIREQ